MNRGQPTLFSPGRHEDAFRVRRPERPPRRVVSVLPRDALRDRLVDVPDPLRRQREPAARRDRALCVRRDGGRTRRCSATPTSVARTSSFRSARTTTSTRRPAIGGSRPSSVPASSRSRSPTGHAARSGRHVDRRQCGPGGHGARLRRPGRDCSLVSIEGNADLDLTKVARPDSVDVGERIEYTITVHNAGTASVFAPVALDRPLDGRIQLLSAATAAGRCRVLGQGTSGQRVRCVLRDLAADESATIVVAARAREPGRDRQPRDRPEPATAEQRRQHGHGVGRDPAAAAGAAGRGGRETEAALHGLMRGSGLRACWRWPPRCSSSRRRPATPSARPPDDGALGLTCSDR